MVAGRRGALTKYSVEIKRGEREQRKLLKDKDLLTEEDLCLSKRERALSSNATTRYFTPEGQTQASRLGESLYQNAASDDFREEL